MLYGIMDARLHGEAKKSELRGGCFGSNKVQHRSLLQELVSHYYFIQAD
jgi:hypothetical protein